MAVPRSKVHPKSSYKFIVSACLAGINCKYDGRNNLRPRIKELVQIGSALPVCPETLGGLSGPHDPCEITGGDGGAVLKGEARVMTSSGRDVTENFIVGAGRAAALAERYNIKKAILKSKSPACGCGAVYDGTFKGVLKKGDGVLTSLLKQIGVKVAGHT